MVERFCFYSLLTIIVFASAHVWAVEARTTNERSLADNNPDANKKPKTPTERQAVKTDRDSELAAIKLVEAHLPDLKSVLNHLRTDDPHQYNLAVRDLAKSARRLEISKNRDTELYDIDVELLQAQSSVRLLTAKLKVRDNQADRKRLREAAGRLQQAELSRADYDVRALQERLERTQKSLTAAEQRLANKQDSDLEKIYIGLLRKAGRKADDEPSIRQKQSQ